MAMPRNRKHSKERAESLPDLGPLQRPLQELYCVNAECPDRGRAGQGNVRLREGKGGGRWRVLRCTTCKREFSERKGTPLWGTRMPPERAEDIARHLGDGCGIRRTARLTGASKNGVTAVALRMGLYARARHDEEVRGLKVDEAQFDEKWSFVGQKQKHCQPSKPEDDAKGDQWDHTAADVPSRFVVSLVVGKRDAETLGALVEDFAKRTGGTPPR